MNELLPYLLIVIGVLIAYAIIRIIIYFMFGYDKSVEKTVGRGMLCLCLIIGITFIPTASKMNTVKKAEKVIKINNYKVLLDGKEVANNNISISNYQVTIDDKAKKVFLTKQTEQKPKTLPIPIIIHR